MLNLRQFDNFRKFNIFGQFRLLSTLPQNNILFSLFELENTCDQKKLRKKYFQLAKKFHPDCNNSVLPIKFAEIKKAYEILSDKSYYKKYMNMSQSEYQQFVDTWNLTYRSKIIESYNEDNNNNDNSFLAQIMKKYKKKY
jgi:curved DNA-binding protein CbpA